MIFTLKPTLQVERFLWQTQFRIKFDGRVRPALSVSSSSDLCHLTFMNFDLRGGLGKGDR